MTLFQIGAISILTMLTLRDLSGFFKRKAISPILRLARMLAWVTAAVAIAWPGIVGDVAVLLGIGRGADVILYLFVLAFLWVSFTQYAAYLRVQRQLTLVVRHLAIRDATFGGPAPKQG